jgi:hypothetical protein
VIPVFATHSLSHHQIEIGVFAVHHAVAFVGCELTVAAVCAFDVVGQHDQVSVLEFLEVFLVARTDAVVGGEVPRRLRSIVLLLLLPPVAEALAFHPVAEISHTLVMIDGSLLFSENASMKSPFRKGRRVCIANDMT